MKIGFSFSRCVADIADGKINIADVLVIIARTDFNPTDEEQWNNIWTAYGGGGTMANPYSNPEWIKYTDDDKDRFHNIALELYQTGRLHQPRQFGTHVQRSPYTWVDTGPIGIEAFSQPDAVQAAWKNYQLLASLTR